MATAQLRLPALVSDSMILQREQPVKLWGWNVDGSEVTVLFNHIKYRSTPDENKKWVVTLPATRAGGPYEIVISSPGNLIHINAVLFGDVWLCSGQSNMDFTMDKLADREATDIANSTNSNIREFSVEKQYSFIQKDDFKGKWVAANPGNVLNFSAVAYYMVRNLYQKYKVPMGVIRTSWGGTPAEAWTSLDGLKDFNHYIEKYNSLNDTALVNATIQKDEAIKNGWYKNVRERDSGFLENGKSWALMEYDDSDWHTMKVPGYWEMNGLTDVDGAVWFRKEVMLTKSSIGKKVLLEVGMLDDSDTTYFNGVKVGSTGNKYLNRKYTVPTSLLKIGKNIITIRITDTDGNGGFIKDKKYRLIIGAKEIGLSGEWRYKVGIKVPAMPVNSFTKIFNYPSVLFNAMIAPLTSYTIKGIAWYQGESNGGKGEEYKSLLPTLIKDWRKHWKQGNLPFLIVQLANYMEAKSRPVDENWSYVREAQLLASQQVPNTALAVTIDIGETNDVHPLNKKEVGERLALAAGHIAYENNMVEFSGPLYKSMKVEGQKVVLSFYNTGKGLMAKGGELTQFAIAGNDKKFVWANAKIQGDKIVVWSKDIMKPVAVRYAWANNPLGANLYNKSGLPASPFRTDNWMR